MNNELLARLLEGDEEAIDQFGESDNCAVIDWRDGFPELISAVEPFLPKGHLQLEQIDEVTFQLYAGSNGPQAINVTANVKQEALIELLNRALMPDFELRQFTPNDGDGYSLYVAPSTVWQEIKRTHPDAVEEYFLSAERLAAYWRKSYLARLFSKP